MTANDTLTELAELREAIKAADSARTELINRRTRLLREGADAGFTVRDLAYAAGITRTRVQQLTGTGRGPRARSAKSAEN